MELVFLTPNTTRFSAEFLLMLPVSISIVSICSSGYAAQVILPVTKDTHYLVYNKIHFKTPLCVSDEQ